MAELITMPSVVADATEAVLERWLIDVGEEVSIGTPLAELETEKATVEYESEVEGVVSRLLVQAGSTVNVGEPIAALTGPGEDETAVEVLLSETHKTVAQGEAGTGGEGSPPTAETPHPAEAVAQQTTQAPGANGESEERRFASPLARRTAREHGIDVSTLTGGGPGGRLLRRDVETAIDALSAPSSPPTSSTTSAQDPAPDDTGESSYRDEPISGMRRAIARRLTESKTTTPHFYLSVDIRMDSLLELRKEIKTSLGSSEPRVTVNDLLLKALGAALREVPEANAVWLGDAIRRFDTVDIAIAMATPKGLLTPVVRNVAGSGLGSLVKTTTDLKERAAQGRIYQQELEGGSFSLSNLGMYGTKEFSAIINPPHAGIVALGTTEQRPVVEDGQLTVGQMMTATLSADHRVIDGVVGAELMDAFAQRLERPLSVLL